MSDANMADRSSVCEIRTLYNNYMRLLKGFVFDDNSDNIAPESTSSGAQRDSYLGNIDNFLPRSGR